jgi:hypothetical protein
VVHLSSFLLRNIISSYYMKYKKKQAIPLQIVQFSLYFIATMEVPYTSPVYNGADKYFECILL